MCSSDLIGAGWAIYTRPLRERAADLDPVERRNPRLFAALANRLGFDELYAATFGRLNTFLSALADTLDRRVWDGAVRLLAGLGAFTGLVTRETDENLLNGGFNSASESLRAGGRAYSKGQTGDTHAYLRYLAIGFTLIALAVLLGGRR